MTNFQQKKIRPDRIIKTHETWNKFKKGALTFIKAHIVVGAIIAVFVTGTFYAAARVTSFTSSLSFGDSLKNAVLSIISSSVEKDEEGSTNILLLGMGGGT
ncbi:MAG: hypothetical protein ACD_65C00101G0001, partial [uncultured bacterium]